MSETRRNFLKLGSATLFGLGAGGAITTLVHQGANASSTPAEGKGIRWGMFIDMTKCADGCTDCMQACHTTHNVPQVDIPKEEMKWVWKQDYHQVFPSKTHEFASEKLNGKGVLTICNHCAEPPCVKVCPTQATFQRKDGIVEMDFHRCIGCRFCMAGCPYGARSFNWRDPRLYLKSFSREYPTREPGVVEKCNFCAERVGTDRQPACVETCPEKALVFGDLNDPDSEIRMHLRKRITRTRKPELGARPSVFYAFGEDSGTSGEAQG